MKTEAIANKFMTTHADLARQSRIAVDHKIVVAETLDGIEKIRDDWQFIRAKYGTSTPFSQFDFYKQICTVFDNRTTPYVVAFYDEGELAALLIGRQTTKPAINLKKVNLRVASMRCWTIAFDGIITDGKTKTIDGVINYLDDKLTSGEIDILNLQALHLKEKASSNISQYLLDRFKVIQTPLVHLYRKEADPESESEVSINSSKTKSTFRRKDRKLCKFFDGKVEMLLHNRKIEVKKFIEGAASVTSQSYQAALGTGVLDNKHWLSIAESLAAIDSFRGYLLKADSIPLAYVFGAVTNDRFILFATGYLPIHQNLSPGTVLMNRVFSSLHDEGIWMFDFGHGDAAYKRILANIVEEDLTLNVYGKRYRSSLAWSLKSCNTNVQRSARSMLEKIHLNKFAKRIWRQRLLNKSIHSTRSQ